MIVRNQELEKYKVAEIRAGMAWASTPAILKAKHDYDAGLTEMCTGRDGDVLILYSIPRKTRARRTPYFYLSEESRYD